MGKGKSTPERLEEMYVELEDAGFDTKDITIILDYFGLSHHNQIKAFSKYHFEKFPPTSEEIKMIEREVKRAKEEADRKEKLRTREWIEIKEKQKEEHEKREAKIKDKYEEKDDALKRKHEIHAIGRKTIELPATITPSERKNEYTQVKGRNVFMTEFLITRAKELVALGLPKTHISIELSRLRLMDRGVDPHSRSFEKTAINQSRDFRGKFFDYL